MSRATTSENLIDQTIAQIDELEKVLSQLYEESINIIDDVKVIKLREQLQRLYERSILIDIDASVEADLATRVWKNCYYKVIEEWRTKIRQLSRIISETHMSDPERLLVANEQRSSHCEHFNLFLKMGISYFFGLLDRIIICYNLDLNHSIPDTLEVGSKEYGRYSLCYKFIIFSGDLVRYQRDGVFTSSTEWKAAFNYYANAMLLIPQEGMSYNQLAVMCTYVNDKLGALYYYARSLAVKFPSLSGKFNIGVLISSDTFRNYLMCREKYMHRYSTPGDEGENTVDIEVQLKILYKGFIGFHGLVASNSSEDLEQIGVLEEDFERLINNDALFLHSQDTAMQSFTDVTRLMQMAVFQIFSMWSTELKSNSYMDLVIRLSLRIFVLLCKKYLSSKVQNLSTLHVLPVLSILSDWFASSPKPVSFDLDDPVDAQLYKSLRLEFTSIIVRIVPFLTKYWSSEFQRADSCVPPLPEELVLKSFLPLEGAFRKVDFYLQPIEHTSMQAFVRRCHKILFLSYRVLKEHFFRVGGTTSDAGVPSSTVLQGDPFFPPFASALILEVYLLHGKECQVPWGSKSLGDTAELDEDEEENLAIDEETLRLQQLIGSLSDSFEELSMERGLKVGAEAVELEVVKARNFEPFGGGVVGLKSFSGGDIDVERLSRKETDLAGSEGGIDLESEIKNHPESKGGIKEDLLTTNAESNIGVVGDDDDDLEGEEVIYQPSAINQSTQVLRSPNDDDDGAFLSVKVGLFEDNGIGSMKYDYAMQPISSSSVPLFYQQNSSGATSMQQILCGDGRSLGSESPDLQNGPFLWAPPGFFQSCNLNASSFQDCKGKDVLNQIFKPKADVSISYETRK